MSESMKGPWLCSLAMVLVGSTVVASRLIGHRVEPFLATALRHAAALPVFLWLLRHQGLRWPRLDRHDALLLLAQSAGGSVGYTVLLMMAVKLGSAGDVSVVTGTLPAVSALLAAAMLGERPGRRLLLAIALATAGLLAVAFAAARGTGEVPMAGRLAGIGCALGAVACEAVFILANKRLHRPMPALTLSTLMSAGGLLLSAVPAWALHHAQPSRFSPSALAAIGYYAWVPTVGGFLLWYAGTARSSGTQAALATAWLPVSALLLSNLVLGEPIHLPQWIGLACVLAAVALAARAPASPRHGGQVEAAARPAGAPTEATP